MEELDVLKKDPIDGRIGIDLRMVARVNGCRARCDAGMLRLVVLEKV